MEEDQGFMYVRDILQKLEEFESSRDIYNSFEDFYPEIISALRNKTLSNL